MGFRAPEVLAATKQYWRLDTPVPVPRSWMRCPICENRNVVPKRFVFFEKPSATVPWRADATFKCGGCALVWSHGIAFDEADWRRFATPGKRRKYERPEIRELLKGIT